MELGNKWTTISQFLPARSDNDVKNIWHSTLRSKNSERRSFLRTYARAVRDCANDADARKQAYEMAQRSCGPPQPIEVALATVQQQYQLALQMAANQTDGLCLDASGQSPDHTNTHTHRQHPQQTDLSSDHDTCGPQLGHLGGSDLAEQGGGGLQDAALGSQGPQTMLQQPSSQHALEPLLDSIRSGHCSQTSSALDPPQQHQHQQQGPPSLPGGHAAALRGRPASPVPDPFNKRLLLSGGPPANPRPAPSPLDILDAAAAAGGGVHPYQSLLQLGGSGGLMGWPGGGGGGGALSAQLPAGAQYSRGGLHEPGSCPASASRVIGEVDPSCLARLSTLQLADQLQRRQQLQQQQQQQQQQLMMSQQHSGFLGDLSGAGGNSNPPSGQQPHQLTLAQPLGSATGYRGAGDGGPLTTSGAMLGVLSGSGEQQQQQQQQHGNDMDELLGLGFDLPSDEVMCTLGGGGGQLGARAGERLLGLTLTAQQQQQQHQGAPAHPHLQSGSATLGTAVGSSLLLGGAGNNGPVRPTGPLSGPATSVGTADPSQGSGCFEPPSQVLSTGGLEGLLAEIEARQQLQGGSFTLSSGQQQQQRLLYQQQQQQQGGQAPEDALGLSLGSGPRFGPLVRSMLQASGSMGGLGGGGGGGGSRSGLIAPNNTLTDGHSLASCSSTFELLPSGQQTFLDNVRPAASGGQPPAVVARRGSVLGMTAVLGGSNAPLTYDSFSNASSGLLSPSATGGGGPPQQQQQQQQQPPQVGASMRVLSPVNLAGGLPRGWQGNAGGSGSGWPAGLLRTGAGAGGNSVHTLSSPVPSYCGEAGGTPGMAFLGFGDAGGGTANAGTLGNYSKMPVGSSTTAGGGGGGGILGRGSGLRAGWSAGAAGGSHSGGGGGGGGGGGNGVNGGGGDMGSLSVGAQVDVVTMGLDSGNLLDCMMDCEVGEPAAAVNVVNVVHIGLAGRLRGGDGGGPAGGPFLSGGGFSTAAAAGRLQPGAGLQAMGGLQGGGRGGGSGPGGSGAGADGASVGRSEGGQQQQQQQHASMPPSNAAGRIRPMVRL